MSVLVVSEHDNAELKPATLHTVAAAKEIAGSDEIHVLVAGAGCEAVAKSAAAMAGVTKVLLVDGPEHEHRLAENLAPVIVALMQDQARGYSHVLAPATTSGKNTCRALRRCSTRSRSPRSARSNHRTPSCARSTPAMRWRRSNPTIP